MALRLIVSASWLWSEQLSWTLAFWSLCLATVPKPVNPAGHVQKLLKFGYFLTAMARRLTHFSIMTLMSFQDQSACTFPLWVLHARVTSLWHLVFTCFYFSPNDQQSSCSASTATILLTAHWDNIEDLFRQRAYIKYCQYSLYTANHLAEGLCFPLGAMLRVSRESKNVGLQQLLLPAKAWG